MQLRMKKKTGAILVFGVLFLMGLLNIFTMIFNSQIDQFKLILNLIGMILLIVAIVAVLKNDKRNIE